ncbi:sensor histidine kinase [bacterium]|nr:sensor histidine kinase [bacterium]
MLYQEAQEAAKARDEFLSIASHELKTPMTALSLQLQLLVRALKFRSELANSYQGVQLCLNQVSKLNELLDDLLDMTRIRTGQVVLNKTVVDLPELLHEIVNRFQPEAQALGTSLTITAENPLSGIWDPLRLEQIFTNLISNAIKYGNRQPVEISVSRRGSQGVVTVQDHGPGIEPEFQKKIFRRFERAPSCGHLGGLGLGLYITHQLVQAHQGTIRLRSEIGRGSQFIVTLPIADLSEGSLPVQKQAS